MSMELNKANECTCPSGDGSLVHPCPAHPAVEQAGGDERAACNLWIAEQQLCQGSDISLFKLERNGALVSLHDLLRDAYQAGQARAALAQPSPVRSSLLINGYQLRAALDFIAPDGTAEQLKSEACIEWRQQDADFLEAGLYAFCAEYPEEGGVLLDEEPTTAQPSPLQSDQAEAERPEVVGYRIMRAQADKIYQRVDKAAAEYEAGRSALGYMEDIAEAALCLRNRLDDLLAAAPGNSVPQAWLDVQAERRRQVEAEGWTPEHDDQHSHGQMARAAACYALAGSSAPNDGTAALLVSLAWPWDEQWWKPSTARRDLVKACALGLAEIERLDRAAAPGKEGV
ncbi:hypothetical protein [Pseudomonas aeruginosa]|uniref:hypothetical protein n=1 Tax=Pseudomonas aeruginosa TaxID=287 RepID=UPI003748D928